MNYTQSKDRLLSLIREGGKLDTISQVKLAALLSFPSMLAQMVHIMMQYIDAAIWAMRTFPSFARLVFVLGIPAALRDSVMTCGVS